MELVKELLETYRELAALKARTEDVSSRLERVHDSLQDIVQRLTRLEANLDSLKSSVKSEIIGEVMAHVAEARVMIGLLQSQPSRHPAITSNIPELPD